MYNNKLTYFMYYKKCQRLLLNLHHEQTIVYLMFNLHLICIVWPHIYDINATANSLKFYFETLNIYLHINNILMHSHVLLAGV